MNSSGCLMLERMFGKIYGAWKWENGRYTLDQASIVDAASPLNASADNSKPYRYYVPKIASVDMWSCDKPNESKTGCGMAALDNFTINSTNNDDVIIEGSGAVSIKFFAWADASQMPLRRFKVEFDNGMDPYISSNSSQSNYKAYCDGENKHCSGDSNISCTTENNRCPSLNKGQCVSNGNDLKASFGSTKTTGCVQRYYEVYGQYSCDVSLLYNSAAKRAIWNENNRPRKRLKYQTPNEVINNYLKSGAPKT